MPERLRRAFSALGIVGLVGGLLLAAPAAIAGSQQTYLVVYRSTAVPADAGQSIASAGGSVVATYGAIGVVVARSPSATFGTAIAADSRVEAAAATANTRVHLT